MNNNIGVRDGVVKWHERLETDYDADIDSDHEEGSQWKRWTPIDKDISYQRPPNKVIDITIDVGTKERQHKLVSTTDAWVRV